QWTSPRAACRPPGPPTTGGQAQRRPSQPSPSWCACGCLHWTAVPTSERGVVVDVAATVGLPLLALVTLAVAALGAAFDLGRGPLEAGPDLVGLQLGDRPLLPIRGLPAALAEPAGDHDPVPLGQGLGQVLGLVAPHVDLEEAGVAVAPLAVLLTPLSDGDPQVGDGGAGVGEADLGVFDQVADDGGVVVRCHLFCSLLVLFQRSGPRRSGPRRVGSRRAAWRASATR